MISALDIVVFVSLLLARRALSFAERNSVAYARTNGPPKGVEFVAMPLFLEEQTFDHSVEFMQIAKLLRGGDSIINNRLFRRFDHIDFSFPGGRAYRATHSDRLFLRSKEDQADELVLEYKKLWFRGYGWYQLHRRYV